MRDHWLELMSLNHESIKYFDVIFCMCVHVHLYDDFH
jgi:hypothetical protein